MTVFKLLYILGMFSAFAFMIVILLVWISADVRGYTYAQFGEPIWYIRYIEFALGFTGVYSIFEHIVIICKEIKER